MSTKLPLKIGVDIRDLWNSPKSTSSLQPSIEAVTKTLGHQILPQVQWLSLWDSLKDRFSDKATFIPTIILYATTWYDQLNWRLDKEVSPEWTEELLSLLSEVPITSLQIEVSPTAKVLHTSWDPTFKVFKLSIPNINYDPHSRLSSSLDEDFENMFSKTSTSSQKAPIVEDGWADIEEPEIRGPQPPLPRKPVQAAAQQISDMSEPKMLPVVNTLTRPNDLFCRTAPYILIVDTGNPLTLQCSHQPSLELIAAYLNRWGKPNPNDSQKRNTLVVELLESEFAVGVMDCLLIEPRITFGRNGPINPAIVLAFIEGVLGYKLIDTTGGRFVYRSDSLLK